MSQNMLLVWFNIKSAKWTQLFTIYQSKEFIFKICPHVTTYCERNKVIYSKKAKIRLTPGPGNFLCPWHLTNDSSGGTHFRCVCVMVMMLSYLYFVRRYGCLLHEWKKKSLVAWFPFMAQNVSYTSLYSVWHIFYEKVTVSMELVNLGYFVFIIGISWKFRHFSVTIGHTISSYYSKCCTMYKFLLVYIYH